MALVAAFRVNRFFGDLLYSLRSSTSLHMEVYTCNSRGENKQIPQTLPSTSYTRREVALGGTGI
jgi:hypothetical protein